MIQTPQKITLAKNPLAQGLKYFLPVIATFWVASFAFSGRIANGMWVGFGAILLCILIIIFFSKRDKKNKRTIELTNEGLCEVNNGVTTFIGWNENHQTYYDGTEFVYGGILPVGTVSKTQVVAEGKRISVHYPQNKFHERILSLSFIHVLPQIEKQLKDGRSVHFGPIKMNQNTIYVKRKEYNIKSIKHIKVENGKVILKMTGSWFSTKILVKDVANLSCMVQLIEMEKDRL